MFLNQTRCFERRLIHVDDCDWAVTGNIRISIQGNEVWNFFFSYQMQSKPDIAWVHHPILQHEDECHGFAGPRRRPASACIRRPQFVCTFKSVLPGSSLLDFNSTYAWKRRFSRCNWNSVGAIWTVNLLRAFRATKVQ